MIMKALIMNAPVFVNPIASNQVEVYGAPNVFLLFRMVFVYNQNKAGYLQITTLRFYYF